MDDFNLFTIESAIEVEAFEIFQTALHQIHDHSTPALYASSFSTEYVGLADCCIVCFHGPWVLVAGECRIYANNWLTVVANRAIHKVDIYVRAYRPAFRILEEAACETLGIRVVVQISFREGGLYGIIL